MTNEMTTNHHHKPEITPNERSSVHLTPNTAPNWTVRVVVSLFTFITLWSGTYVVYACSAYALKPMLGELKNITQQTISDEVVLCPGKKVIPL